MTHRAFCYVAYGDIPDYLDMGWLALIPATFEHINFYGIEMAWLCDCPVPSKIHPQQSTAYTQLFHEL